jgi:hypothetical protein
MEIKTTSFSAVKDSEASFIWAEFEARRLEFWELVRQSADASDQELARSPTYNTLLHYGLKAHRTAGAIGCGVLALALLQGHPEPAKAEAALHRFWAGLLPEQAPSLQLPLH